MDIAIFLIGSNPLPIFVVLKYLLNENRPEQEYFPKPDKVIFIHSSDTESFVKNIKKELNINNIMYTINLGDKQRDAQIIIEEIKRKIEDLSKNHPITSIHLNYTGGTKPMAVHAYKAVDQFSDKYKTIFSDLDSDNYKIVTYENNHYPEDGDLRNVIKISISTIFELHSMKINSKYKGTNNYEIENLNIEQFSDIAIKNIKSNWKNLFIKIKEDIQKNKTFDQNSLNLLIPKYNDNIKLFDKLFKSVISFSQFTNSPDEFNKFIDFCHGKWLEDYMLFLIKKVKENEGLNITEVVKSIEAHYNDRPTELDLIVMKGFQMYLISVTTSQSIKTVKGKAFEALYRAEQLGGLHAQVIMVSLLPESGNQNNKDNNLKELEKDLSSFDAKLNKKIRLIGLDDLKDKKKMENKLLDIFNN